MKTKRTQNLFAWSVILRNVSLILLAGFIIIGVRAWFGDFKLHEMHILEVIIHYLYFISVLGYLCINMRILYLHIVRSKGAEQSAGNEGQLTFGQIIGNIAILIVCIVGCCIIMRCEGESRVVDWIVLQNGLIVWCMVIYVGETIAVHMHSDCKNIASCESEIRKDSFYIPTLLEKIESNELKNYIAHELYTYAIRARFYKYGYYICSITALVAPTIVVILNSGFSDTDLAKLGVSIFSGIAAVASGMLGIVKFKESWTRYRYNCEVLKSEVSAYINKRGYYANVGNKEKIFYEHINEIISGEIYDWKKLRQENNN